MRTIHATFALILFACEGPRGPAGPPGDDAPEIDAGDPVTAAGSGLVVEIVDAEIDGDVATAVVELTDVDGAPVDRGEVEVSFVLAHLGRLDDGGAGTYTAYTTRDQTSPDTGVTATQASGESSGTWEDLGDGRHRYTFATEVDVADADATHTIGVWATREHDGAVAQDDDTFDFVPDGGDVEVRRDVTADAACAQCHVQVRAHGGARRSIELCVLCHSPQTTDPDTGNTVDMRVMIHKIHMGKRLPSVMAGEPYQIVGYMQSLHDYSTVAFPAPNSPANCVDCHTGDHWKTNLAESTCSSCHDRTWFGAPAEVPAGYEVHGGGPQPTESCDVCHATDLPALPPTSVVTVHRVGMVAADRPQPALSIVSVDATGPGQRPVITFQVTVDGQPRDLLAQPLAALRATFAGPNTDYARYWQVAIQGTGAAGELAAGSAPGEHVWTAPQSAAIPADATGSYTVALEGSVLDSQGVRIPADAALTPVAVTGQVRARRVIVEQESCDQCHERLTFHGGNRANVQYCPTCHNPNNVNDERIARVEGSERVRVHTVQFTNMIHRVHMGEELTQPYVLGANPTPNADNPRGTQEDFAETRYPAPRDDCGRCHAEGTHMLTDDPTGLLPAFDQIFACSEEPGDDDDELCEPFDPSNPEDNAFRPVETIQMYPQTAACTGCHDAPSTFAHAMVMTTVAGVESCATCHGEDGAFEAHGEQGAR